MIEWRPSAASGFLFGYVFVGGGKVMSKRSSRFLTVAALVSLGACGSAENGADPSAASPSVSVSIPPSSASLTGADLCALLTDADRQALGLAGRSRPWDRPHKMGGSRRSGCGWSGATEVGIGFHESGVAKVAPLTDDFEVSREQINGREAKKIVHRKAPMNCLIAVEVSTATHLEIDSGSLSGIPDMNENCAFVKRVAQAAMSRISG
ncbi:DUF3558 family protein [Amycolatopsis azurea]|nr:DUF3558 family protein [Amycolatopsis azurea]